MQNPMHFKTGVVSASIAGVRQFRTRAQTSKNTKQRKDEFAISSGSPPPNRSRSASLPGVVFGGSRVSEASSSFQGQRATSEHNLQQKKPAHTPMQSAFGGAIAHTRVKALDRQTIKHQLGTPKQHSRHLQHPLHFKTGVGAPMAGVQQVRTKVQTSKHSKHEKASSPFLQGVHLQQVQVRKPSWCCVWWFQGVSDIVPPQGQRARSEHSLQQKQPAPPPCNPHLEEQLRTKAQRPRTDTPPNQQAPTWETKAKGQQPQQPNAFQNRCGE